MFLTCRHLACQCLPSSYVLPQWQRCSQLECPRHTKLCNLHKPHKHSSHSAQCCIMYLICTASQSPSSVQLQISLICTAAQSTYLFAQSTSSVQLYNLPHLFSCTIYLIYSAAQSTSSVQPHNLAQLYSHALYLYLFSHTLYLVWTVKLPHQYSYKIYLICTTTQFTSSLQQHNLPHKYSYTIHLICTARQFTSSVQSHNLPRMNNHTIYLLYTATQSTFSVHNLPVQPHILSHLFSHTIYPISSATKSITSVQLHNLSHLFSYTIHLTCTMYLPHLYSHTIFLICTATQSTFSVQPHNLPFLYTIILICSATQSTSSVQPHNLPNLFYQNQNPNPNIYCPNTRSAIQSASSVLPHNLPHLFSHTICFFCSATQSTSSAQPHTQKKNASLHSAQCCIFDLSYAVFTIYCLSRNVSYSPIGSSGPSHSNWNKSTLHRPIHILTVAYAPGIQFFSLFSLPYLRSKSRKDHPALTGYRLNCTTL